ncbi:MAG: hypothetical protein CMM61_04195 [Rhodospirillaceae bacterium]|nr:hypothetical protein [Rhodospirillaceae bacterium]
MTGTDTGRGIRDENLRLVLSPGQEQWIDDQLAMAKGLAWVSAIFFALAVAWLTAASMGLMDERREAACVSLPLDTPNYTERMAELRDQGLRPCGQGAAADNGFNWRDLHWVVSLLAMLIAFISPMTLGRNLFLVRRYKGYQRDHEAFLAKYHRS